MANKFRALEPIQDQSPDTARPAIMGMAGGFRGDVSPRQVPPDASPGLNDVRFERTGLRKEFGWVALGDPAATVIYGMIDHKYINVDTLEQDFVRLIISGGFWDIEIFDAGVWTSEVVSSEVANAVYLSLVSAVDVDASGCMYLADGTQILRWCRAATRTPRQNDFPTGNALVVQGDETVAIITPGDIADIDYSFNFDVRINSGVFGGESKVEIGLFKNISPDAFSTALFIADGSAGFPATFPNQAIVKEMQLDDGDTVTLRVLSAFSGDTVSELDNVDLTGGGGEPVLVGDKSPTSPPAVDSMYNFIYSLDAGTYPVTVEFYVNNGFGYQGIATRIHASPDDSTIQAVFFDNLDDPSARFGIDIISGSAPLSDVQVRWTRDQIDFSVHGHNLVDDGDISAGVEYEIVGPVESQFGLVSEDAPAASFIVYFARRLIALRNGIDSQLLSWTVDGILTDWIGVGSGADALVESRSDPIDALQAASVLNSNFMALFRERSIMRVFETGQPAKAIGIVSWLEEVGTDAPFSVRPVRGGTMFLGNDLMVYYLTEQGPQPVGNAIVQELIDTLGDVSLVDGGYNPKYEEYQLGIPVGGASNITRTWIFEVGTFLDKQEIVWRRRDQAVERYETGDFTVLRWADDLHDVLALDDTTVLKDGVAFIGTWESPSLNQVEEGKSYGLNLLELLYFAPVETQATIFISGDGVNWDAGQTVIIPASVGQISRVQAGSDIAGFDLRFKIELDDLADDDEGLVIYGYRPHLVDRGDLLI